MTSTISAAALVAIVLMSGCTGTPSGSSSGTAVPGRTSAPPPDSTITTETPSPGATHRTTVVVTAPSPLSVTSGVDACEGKAAYASIHEGTAVLVLDRSGAVLTSVPLGQGRRSGEADGCTWSAEVVLPTDRGSYRAVIEGWGSSALLSVTDLYKPIVIKPDG